MSSGEGRSRVSKPLRRRGRGKRRDARFGQLSVETRSNAATHRFAESMASLSSIEARLGGEGRDERSLLERLKRQFKGWGKREEGSLSMAVVVVGLWR